MSTSKIVRATPRPVPAQPAIPAWALAGLVLLALAGLLVLASAPAPAPSAGLAAPEPQRVLEDWRGNSAGLERPAQ